MEGQLQGVLGGHGREGKHLCVCSTSPNLQRCQSWMVSLLVGIFNITKSKAVAPVDTCCNECSKTWQLCAAGMGLHQHTQPGHSMLGTINAGM